MQHGLDTRYLPLDSEEWEAFHTALKEVENNARWNAYKRPRMTTLLEEFAELVLAFRGKHDDPAELELTQIAGVAINLLWQLRTGTDVNNIVTFKEDTDARQGR